MIFKDKKQAYKFLQENWNRVLHTQPINIKFINSKDKVIENYGLKWFFVNNKSQACITGQLHILVLFLGNHYVKKNSIVDILKYINKNGIVDILKHINKKDVSKDSSINKIIKKEKKKMAKKVLSKIEKAFNLLKDGKKVKVTTIAKKIYGDDSDYSKKNVSTMISDLRKKGYKIVLVEKGIYQLQKISLKNLFCNCR